MQAQILAAIAAAVVAAEPPAAPSSAPPSASAGTKTVSPVTVSPLSKQAPADAKVLSAGSDDDPEPADVFWPSTAYQAGFGGKARLRCLIDVHGLAERCDVASEDPAGKGFGRAALQIRSTFKLPPPQGPDGPVAGIKIIEVDFKAPGRNFEMGKVMKGDTFGQGNALRMTKVAMLDFPVWARAASFDDLAAAYPKAGDGLEGYAVAHCDVRRTGDLRNCAIVKETPEKHGFGRAALILADRFRVDPRLAQTHVPGKMMVDVPIRFPAPAELAQRTVMAPSWITGFDRSRAPGLFPPEAAANGLTSGRGVARCTVSDEGTLTACAPEAGDPAGLGFSEVAVKLAATMKMNLWGADGAPVEGGTIHVPIRLNLKGGGDGLEALP
jgi:hypothetical protein